MRDVEKILKTLQSCERRIIEDCVSLDGEWGKGRKAEQIELDGDLPEEVYEIRLAMEILKDNGAA